MKVTKSEIGGTDFFQIGLNCWQVGINSCPYTVDPLQIEPPCSAAPRIPGPASRDRTVLGELGVGTSARSTMPNFAALAVQVKLAARKKVLPGCLPGLSPARPAPPDRRRRSTPHPGGSGPETTRSPSGRRRFPLRLIKPLVAGARSTSVTGTRVCDVKIICAAKGPILRVLDSVRHPQPREGILECPPVAVRQPASRKTPRK